MANSGNLEKAGKLLRFFGWLDLILIVVAILGITAATLIPAFAGRGELNLNGLSKLSHFVPFLLLAIGTAILYLFIGSALIKHKPWGKIAGTIISIIALIGFPIGTIIGIIILYFLIKGWNENNLIG